MLPPPPPAQRGPPTNADDAIRETDDDAAASRVSATTLGYLSDPFASLLYKAQRVGPSAGSARKAPLINIGTHHRTCALDAVVDSFLAAAPDGQIVSLGAGSDTRFWRLMSRENPPPLSRYVELDFTSLTARKAQRIARSPRLAAGLGPSTGTERAYTVSQGGAALTSSVYALAPVDLRKIDELDAVLSPLLDTTKAVLLISECVLCYMSPTESAAVLGWFGGKFDKCAAVVYEMCGLDDAFGRVMRRNLAQRNLSLPGAVFADSNAQAERFLTPALPEGEAFAYSGGKTLWEIRSEIVPKDELARISKLEILDEIEELRLVLSHYCVAWGSLGEGMEGVGL